MSDETEDSVDLQVQRAIGRQLKDVNEWLRMIYVWLVVGVFIAGFMAALVALWLFGVITVELKPTSSGL